MGLAREIVLVDKNELLAQGEIMDLNNGLSLPIPQNFVPKCSLHMFPVLKMYVESLNSKTQVKNLLQELPWLEWVKPLSFNCIDY